MHASDGEHPRWKFLSKSTGKWLFQIDNLHNQDAFQLRDVPLDVLIEKKMMNINWQKVHVMYVLCMLDLDVFILSAHSIFNMNGPFPSDKHDIRIVWITIYPFIIIFWALYH
jgi:hypothetical protein